MDLQRFDEFRRKSQMLIRSTDWLTKKINIVLDKMEYLPEDTSDKAIEDLLDKMGHLQQKINWEEQQYIMLIDEYKDLISNDNFE